MLDNILTLFGKLFVLYFGIKLLCFLYHFLRVYKFSTCPDFSKYGKWSVVTGATNGIGKEFAFQLASKGQNVILIARNKEMLKEVSTTIASRFGVQAEYLQVDFSQDEMIYEKIEMFLKDYDIGVLVNNVGMALPVFNFTEIPNLSKCITNMTRVNILSALKMIQIVLPGMEQRRRGCIINVSSGSAFHITQKMALYAATKAFLNHLSLILSYEYEDKGIIIQCCCPYYVKSNMTKLVPGWEKMVLAEDYVQSMLATVGKERITCGSAKFLMQNIAANLVPLTFWKYMSFANIIRLNNMLSGRKLKD